METLLILLLLAPGGDEEVLARCERVLMRIDGVRAVEFEGGGAARKILVTVANRDTGETVKLLTKGNYQGFEIKILIGAAKAKPALKLGIPELECDLLREKFALPRRDGVRCRVTYVFVSVKNIVVEETKVVHHRGCPLEGKNLAALDKISLQKDVRESAFAVRDVAPVEPPPINPQKTESSLPAVTSAQLNYQTFLHYERRGRYYEQYDTLQRLIHQKTDPDLAAIAETKLRELSGNDAAIREIERGIMEHDYLRYMSLGDTYRESGLLSLCLPHYERLIRAYPDHPRAEEAREKIRITEQRIGQILQELEKERKR